ncbi:Retrovirus-related Pol polyprotein from type-1 retrotransposable element R2 [Dictyocoela muelleri]|nr:Retrovirus-related Pol polyprotein from type-1 retrotransposable element R2 [Dictyocoela muelleri]
MGFGSTKRKNKKTAKLIPKPQKTSTSIKKHQNDVGINAIEERSPGVYPASKNDEFEKLHPNDDKLNTSFTINQKIDTDNYFNLGKEALKIFYKHTNGAKRASNNQWSMIYDEYMRNSGKKLTLSSFKIYMIKTKKLFNQSSSTKNPTNSITQNEITKKSYENNHSFINTKNQLNNKDKNTINVIGNELFSNVDIDLIGGKLICIDTKQSGSPLNNKNHPEKLTNKPQTFFKNLNESVIDQNKHLSISKNDEISKQSKYSKQFKFIKDLTNDEKINIKKTFEVIFNETVNKSYSSENFCYKIPSHKVDWAIISQINNVISDILKHKSNMTLHDITKTLLSAQLTYQSLKNKPNKIKKIQQNTISTKINMLQNKLKFIAIIKENFENFDKKCLVYKDLIRNFGEINSLDDLNRVEFKVNNILRLLIKKEKTDSEYKIYKRTNTIFELNRRAFYEGLEKENLEQPQHIDPLIIKNYWKNMWKKDECFKPNYDKILQIFEEKSNSICEPEPINLKFEDFVYLINKLQPWKAAGPDGIYNFWIKNIAALHEPLHCEFSKILTNIEKAPENFFDGRTIFFHKNNKDGVENLRPITCQSNIYKLFTRILKLSLLFHVQNNKIISINQAGAMPQIHASKEQFLLNKSIISNFNHKLKVAYIDVKKAFDTVDRSFLIKLLEIIKAPQEIINFIKKADKSWKSTLQYRGEDLDKIHFERGIPQGDSLSPLFFTIIMEYITQSLIQSKLFPLDIVIDDDKINLNHLLYMDDIKLYSENKSELIKLLEESKISLNKIGMDLNISKCGANSDISINDQNIKTDTYKYLGVIENFEQNAIDMNLEIIEKEILRRFNLVLNSKLSSKNMVTAVNEYAISVINYFIGIIDLDDKFCKDLDRKIRRIMIKYKFHFIDSSIERLYLPRWQNGRGVKSIFNHVEAISYNFSNYVNENNTPRKKIIKIGLESSPDSKILYKKKSIIEKYMLNENEINKSTFKDIQKNNLLESLKNKALHGTFFKKLMEMNLSHTNCNEWLLHGNQKPSSEAYGFLMQDRYLSSFYNSGKCKFCKKANVSIDHLATRCGLLLHSSYIRRHNEVVKCIHLRLMKKFGITLRKKLKGHKIEKVVKNENAEIISEIPIKTDSFVTNNKPDLILFDNKKNIIYLIEIGITSLDNLKKYEVEKFQKYRLLAREMEQIYSRKVLIIPYVITWDGVTTNYNKKYRKIIDIDDGLHAYIQGVCLRLTSEILELCLNKDIEENKDLGPSLG